jgi:hypothetical protein
VRVGEIWSSTEKAFVPHIILRFGGEASVICAKHHGMKTMQIWEGSML